MENEVYLGDGAYAKWEGNQLLIYTSDGIRITNRVYLEPDGMLTLIHFWTGWMETKKTEE